MANVIRRLFSANLSAETVSEITSVAAEVVDADGNDDAKQREFIASAVTSFLESRRYSNMLAGQRYFENRNDIRERKRTVIGRDGLMVEAPYLANNKLSHSFMRKLTKQKIGYLLTQPFTITSEDETFQELVMDYFDQATYLRIKNVGQDAIVKSIGWLQAYYNQRGDLRFKRIPSTELIPFWADIDHTSLEAAIRVFDVVRFDGGDKKIVRYVKYFVPERIYNYVDTESGLIPDPEQPTETYFTVQQDPAVAEDGNPVQVKPKAGSWARIPLIAFKYNAEEESLLTYIKDLIDDYDLRTSDISNALEDEPNKIKVIKDYDGTDKGEFIYNLAKYRALFLKDTGDVSTLDTTVDVTAAEAHLTRVRRDIFECGSGVDTQTKELGSASGVALRFVYSDLDADCTDFSTEISVALQEMIWFIKQDLLIKGKGDFTEVDFEIAFNMDLAINESETITNIMNSEGLLSQKTLVEHHPYVKDAALELAQIKNEQDEALETAVQQARIPETTEPAKGEDMNGKEDGTGVLDQKGGAGRSAPDIATGRGSGPSG